ncbi:unnamed protein product [Ambrosiozyma monospora]|uniref:Unnamed protein product n=1 Tax=Ambrosiozyma monospora TaxID=43982 RepID=A0ACB5SYD3_AMBMO|nr:unnamed protein product [Ambrosiozyma monospora]
MIYKILLRRPSILLIPRNQFLLCQRRRFSQSIWKSQSPPFSSKTPNTKQAKQAKGTGDDEDDAASKIQERASKLIDEIEFQKHKLDEEKILSPAPGIKEKVNSNDQGTKNEEVKKDTRAEPNDTKKKDISDDSITQSGLQQYLKAIMESENYKSLKAELTRFNDNRLKKQNQYSEQLHKRLEAYATELQGAVRICSRLVNDITGYTKVMDMKQKIVEKEENMRNLRKRIIDAKLAHNTAVDDRAACQKSINELLERKHNWGNADLERFTSLYRSDHDLEKTVQDTLVG